MIHPIEFSKQERKNQEVDVAHLDHILGDFRRDGFVVLKDAFPKEYIDALYRQFIGRYALTVTGETHTFKSPVSHRRFQCSIEVDAAFNSPRLYANPFVLPVMERLFDYKFIISDLTYVTSLPGAKTMSPHADGRIFEHHPIANLLPPHAVGLLIPLIPFNQLNGPTRIWPGSQRIGPSFENVEDKSNFVDVEVDTGSCILMDHRIYHAGNTNNSTQLRPLLYLNYSAIWYYVPP